MSPTISAIRASPPSESFVPATRAEAGDLVLALSRGKAEAVLQADALADDFEGWLGITGEVARDYAGRFVAELIQNAHDAHGPTDMAGEIDIVFNPHEGPSGTLYVANKGRPFTYGDLCSISVLAKSSKHPGQGIGNKGVGFKSVFLVSEAPEIYSAGADRQGGALDGFCFTFAARGDYLTLAGGDAAAAERLRKRRHNSGLPMPLARDGNVTVQRLADRGHNVVVRLPLRRKAAGDVHGQLRELVSGGAPMLLFLKRIRRLRVDIAGEEPVTLERRVEAVRADVKLNLELVKLGAQGTYLCSTAEVPANRFRRALLESVEQGRIDTRWLEWSDPAMVSVAVRTDVAGRDDRLYCFLPMGEDARSPFQGHVNAPFSVALARKALVENTPLNELLLDVSAELACRTAAAIAASRRGRIAASDLIAWKPDGVERLLAAGSRERVNLERKPLLAIVPRDALGSVGTAWAWTGDGMAVMTPPTLAQAKVEVLDPSLGQERIGRITAFAERAFGRPMKPGEGDIAQWAEDVAEILATAERRRRRLDVSRWLAFYDDLAALAGTHPALPVRLATRRIVIDNHLHLLPCRGSAAGKRARGDFTVFFRPGSTADDEGDDAPGDLDLPPSLGARLAFPHHALRWLEITPQGRGNRPGRDLLQDAGIRQWRLEDLYPVVGALVDASEDKRVWSDALGFVFAAYRRTVRSRLTDVGPANLRVPTVDGTWKPAREVRFGKRWPEATLGPDLGAFVATAGDDPEIERLRSRLLAPFDGRRYRGTPEEWAAFLSAAGVAKGLAPENLVPRPLQLPKWQFRAGNLLDRLGLSLDRDRAWADAIEAAEQPTRRSPWTLRGPVYRIPGQGALATFSPEARQRFSDLVLAGLPTWPADAFHTEVERLRWPSPAASFLRTAAWLPAGRPAATAPRFVAAPDAWHYIEDEGGIPTYAELVQRSVRARIGASQVLWDRLSDLGVKEWGDPDCAPARLKVLTDLAATDLPENQRQYVRRAYERSWANVVARKLPLPWTEAPALVVTVKGRLQVHNPRRQRGKVYVLTWRDALAEALVDEREVARLRVEPKDAAAVAALLRPMLGDRLVEIGRRDITVSLGGRIVRPSPADSVLVTSHREWLADLLAITLNLVFRTDVTPQSTARAVGRLRRIRLRFGSPIKVNVRNTVLEDTDGNVSVVPVDDDRLPTIVIAGDEAAGTESLRWPQLEAISSAIAELVRYPSADVALRFAISKLAGGSIGPIARPNEETYAAALSVREAGVREVLLANRDLLNRLVFVLRPVVACLGSNKALKALDSAGEEGPSERRLLELCAQLRLPGSWTPDSLLVAAREADTPSDLRDRLGIPFVEFNAALEALGGAYEPDRQRDVHEAEFARWLGDQRDRVTLALRAAALPSFDAGSIPAWYPAAIAELDRACRLDPISDVLTVARLSPDPAWLDEMHTPTPDVMQPRVGTWLGTFGATAASGRVPGLAKLADVRRSNGATVDLFARRAAPVVAAWSRVNDMKEPQWVSAGPRALSLEFQGAGLLDFRRLSAAAVLEWLPRLAEAWPLGMPLSVTPDNLGLTAEQVTSVAVDLAAQGEPARARARRTMPLDGHDVSLVDGGVADVLALVDASLAGLLEGSPGLAQAGPLPEARSGGGGRGGRGGAASDSGLSDAQLDVMGFIGELIAYRWLCHHLGAGRVTWCSGLALHYDATFPGDDGLGYDMRVVDPGILVGRDAVARKLFIEVKAIGDPRLGHPVSFSLTRKEVEFAQEHADDGSYFVLVVSNALNSERRAIHLLPNPFSTQGRTVFRDLSETRTMLFNLPE